MSSNLEYIDAWVDGRLVGQLLRQPDWDPDETATHGLLLSDDPFGGPHLVTIVDAPRERLVTRSVCLEVDE